MIGTEPIMMIEDDDGHARLIEKNMRRSGLTNPIRRFADGASALGFLFDAAHAQSAIRPSLILLDLNLPDVSGIEILRQIKREPSLRITPVIVLTTTDDKSEIQRCYDLGCNVYVTKPLADLGFAATMQQIGQFIALMRAPDLPPPP